MKRALLLSVCLLVVASMAFAQTGSIGLFADPGATSCDVYDAAAGLVLVYVVHVFTPGATASQFMVTGSGTMTYLSEAVTAPFIKIGTCAGPGATGCAIAYGACVGSPNMILTLQYFASGTTPACDLIQVVADPSATPPGIYVTDCADPPLLLTATGGTAIVNPVEGCFCNVPVEETSWGQIKSLYR